MSEICDRCSHSLVPSQRRSNSGGLKKVEVVAMIMGSGITRQSRAASIGTRDHFDLLRFGERVANSGERPMTALGFSSLGGLDIPLKASLDFHVPSAYMRDCRRKFTPSLHVMSMRFPVSLNPITLFIVSQTAGAVSATASLICSTYSFCSRSGMPKVVVMNFARVFPGSHVFLPKKLMPGGLCWYPA